MQAVTWVEEFTMDKPRHTNGARWEFWALLLTIVLNLLAGMRAHGALEQQVADLVQRVNRLEQRIDQALSRHAP